MNLLNTAIETHNLSVSYNQRPVLWNIDFELPTGNIIGILGPNGSGKTTLLKAIMGLVKTSSGYVKVFDSDLDAVRERISYVPQRESVDWNFPANVMDIVLMGRYRRSNLTKRLSSHDRDLAAEALEKVNMLEFSNRQISQLSGGQQQRVFIARSLCQGADLYIMDEPFIGVDAATEEAIMDLLMEMRNEGKTVIVVHHDLQSAKEFFDWIVLLNTRLVASGPISEVFTEELLQQAFGGKLNALSRVGELIREHEFPIREKNKNKKKQ